MVISRGTSVLTVANSQWETEPLSVLKIVRLWFLDIMSMCLYTYSICLLCLPQYVWFVWKSVVDLWGPLVNRFLASPTTISGTCLSYLWINRFAFLQSLTIHPIVMPNTWQAFDCPEYNSIGIALSLGIQKEWNVLWLNFQIPPLEKEGFKLSHRFGRSHLQVRGSRQRPS